MSNRAYVTALLLLVLAVSLAVLAVRWAVVARRVPLIETRSQADYAGSHNPKARTDGSAARATAADWQTAETESAGSTPEPAAAGAGETSAKAASAGDGEAKVPAGKDGKTAHPAGEKIDINAASATQLTALPGIGEVLAQRIVEYRKQHGQFKRVDELLNVSGIGEKKLAQIKGYLYVR